MSQPNLQFGGTGTNFNSTLNSNRNTSRLGLQSAMNIQDTVILPNDRNMLTLTAEYDTYMMSSIYSQKGNNHSTSRVGSSAANKGKINVMKNDFNMKSLILPAVDNTHGDKSFLPHQLFETKSSIMK